VLGSYSNTELSKYQPYI